MMTFDRRFVLTGHLMLRTALHLGGGNGVLSASDSPIVRTPEGRPFVPGSSFKGAFRSTVEKLAGVLPGVRTCALVEGDGGHCPGAPGRDQDTFNRRRRDGAWSEARLVHELGSALCDTCQLFGSPFQAARLRVSDLYLAAGEDPITQVRDGVGIDRDSERAVDQIKFDFEVVEAGTAFDVELILDDPSPTDLGLTCIGLSEYVAGFGRLGGKRSRGLGSVRLANLQVFELDLRDEKRRAEQLRRYLVGGAGHAGPIGALGLADRLTLVDDVDAFLRQHVDALLQARSR